ncbi:MAG: DUF4160 domain-containing protein [Alphaproteobacteria bacterium]
MPTIVRFGNIIMFMNYVDHNPPHVHLLGPDVSCLLAIRDGQLLEGFITNKALKIAQKYITENRSKLMELWDRYQK